MELFVAFGLAIVAGHMYSRYVRYGRYLTFREYRDQYPEHVAGGRVRCRHCGGSHIQFRGLDNAADRRKTHFCVACGAPLYRSYH